MADDIFTLDDNNNAAIRTVSVNAGASETNSPIIFTTDENGNACVRVTGSGGGDSHNKGYYATQAALEEAYPTASAGDWAIVGATDTVWIWDTDTSAWVDSDTKGQVVSVNSKTGTVVLTAEDVNAVPQYTTMPVASLTNAGEIVQFIGTTGVTYTNGYFYKNITTTTPSSATASQTTGSSLTDVAVVVATFETQITTSGSYVFTSDGTDWSYDGNVVDLTDYGITYTGTPVADDAITITYTAAVTTYAWTRVDVQPAPVIPDPLPSQTGNAGKFLTTDGTDASWSDKPLVNAATGANSIVVSNDSNAYAAYNSVTIGNGAKDSGDSVVIGYHASTSSYNSVIIGSRANASGSGCVCIGKGATCLAASAGQIVIGWNNTTNNTNSDANTFKIGNMNGNFEIMSADGTVPHARLTNAVVSNAITIAVADWNGGTTCTKTISGLTATSVVWVAPDNASQSDYLTAGVYASAQTTDTITFTATTTPTSALTVNVIYC